MRDEVITLIKAAAERGVQSQAEDADEPRIASQMDDGQQVFTSIEDILPKEEDYIHPPFRALSQTLVECYSLDWSKPGVLEAAVPLLEGQTVYKNHNFYDVERWLGVISKSWWDADGASSDGIPGINVELKIDAKMNPRIARGLMMKPPAIHSFSLTVLFVFEFSHPDLVEEGRFWSLLGEEVGGSIVRLIVTKILAIWEGSLVFQGADTYAKQLPVSEETEGDDELSARRKTKMQAGNPPQQQQKERKTVKFSTQRKQAFGITHESDEVPDEIVLQTMESLSSRAATVDTLLGEARAECLRVATLATVGAEGALPEALASVINGAGAAQLKGLTELYTKQAGEKFPQTCQSCGHKTEGRSSVEDRTGQPDAAGGASQSAPVPVTLH